MAAARQAHVLLRRPRARRNRWLRHLLPEQNRGTTRRKSCNKVSRFIIALFPILT